MKEELRKFFAAIWRRSGPRVLALAVDTVDYLAIWLAFFVAHLAKVLFAAMGLDADVIQIISVLEKVVWITIFAAFFWRILLRIMRSLKD